MTTDDTTSEPVTVRDLAHARAGDKGDVSNVGVIAYDEACYDVLREALTEDLVARELDALLTGDVTRYDMPNIHAFNFVLEGALDGGGTRTLRIDRLGKSMSNTILEIELDVPVPDGVRPDDPG